MIWQDISSTMMDSTSRLVDRPTQLICSSDTTYKYKLQQTKTYSRIIFYQRIMIIEAILTQLNPRKGSLVFNN